MENKQQSGTGTVTITRSEYETLRSNSGATVTSGGPGLSPSTSEAITPTRSELIWFLLGVMVLLSFLLGFNWIFILPMVLFAVAAGSSFFKDSKPHSSVTKGAVLTIKVLSVIAITVFIVFALWIGFFILALSSSGGHI